jgi:hypothetical protein
MNKVDKNRPVSSIKHEGKRAAIPDSAHQGEEQMAISGMPEQNEYDIFRHEFQRVLIAVWRQAGNASCSLQRSRRGREVPVPLRPHHGKKVCRSQILVNMTEVHKKYRLNLFQR